MLGKLVRSTFACAALGGLVVTAAGCPRMVKGDANSGKDARDKGAKTIKLENGEAQVRDIVTYPGGDRVDWKLIELPEGQKGDLRIKLKWRPARPGMDLAFDVFDEYGERLERAKPVKRVEKYNKRVKIRGASGKYYVQVYAPKRSDAGRYRLQIRFKERTQKPPPSPEELADQISDPPTLPDVIVPEPEVPKTPEQLEQERLEKERLEKERLAQEEADRLKQEELDALRKPVYAQIIKTQNASGGTVLITINKGSNHKVERGWEGVVLRGSSNDPLPGGDFTLIRVTSRESIGKVKVPPDQLRKNLRVQLRRPL